ncbi:MAG: hypothetical protein JW884_04290, partial [Deltaproteobacteria bacterium]|nr:hypothetical protein [Deltaproteobacteria bacterium]
MEVCSEYQEADRPAFNRDILESSDPATIADRLGLCDTSSGLRIERLPFAAGDTTAGVENEFQTAVIGNASSVDLSLVISGSRYFKNIISRANRGDTPRKLAYELEKFLQDHKEKVWESSWVRVPLSVLSLSARELLEWDLKADKSSTDSRRRSDADRFFIMHNG